MKTLLIFAGIPALFALTGIGALSLGTSPAEPPQEPRFGAPSESISYTGTNLPISDSTYDIGTTTQAYREGWFDELCLTGDACRTSWPAGGGGSGSVGTSTVPTIGHIPLWTTSGETPERIGSVATTSLTASSPLSLSQPISVIGSSASALTLDTSGAWTGNAGTASALAANGANCSAGQYPLGIDASGNVESCTADSDTQLTEEQVEDFIGAGFSGNTETLITATYQDVDGTFDFVVDGNLSNYTNDAGFVTSADDTVSGTELDGVFSTTGLLRRTGAATYSTITDSSSNWNTAYGWGDHGAAGYLTTLSDISLTKGYFIVGDDAGAAQATSSVFISSTGNVGIGLTSPGTKLDVLGTASSTNLFVNSWATSTSLAITGITDSLLSTNSLGQVVATTSIGLNLIPDNFLRNDTDDTTTGQLTAANFVASGAAATSTFAGGLTVQSTALVVQDDSGNVGVGTSSPAGKLHVYSGDSGVTPFSSPVFQSVLFENDQANLIEFMSGDGFSTTVGFSDTDQPLAGRFFYNHYDDTFSFFTNQTQQVTIDANGNLGIGDTSPDAHLEVSASGSSGGNIFLLSSDDNNNGDLLTVTESGNVGIGTTSPGSLLSLNGIANFTTATSTFYGNGINLTDGCFAINGTCVGGGGGGGGDNVSIDGTGVTDPDFVSTGDIDFVDTSNTITANLNSGVIVNADVNASAAIDYSKLNLSASLIETDLDADVAPVDGDFLQYDSTGTNFTWRSASETKTDLSLNNVENTALSTWAGSSNITTLGTIGTGVWQGTAIADSYLTKTGNWTGTLDGYEAAALLDNATHTGDVTGSGALSIASGVIIEPDLSADVAPVDGDFLQYDSTGTNFTWRNATELASDIESAMEAALDTLTSLTDVIVSTALEIPNGTGPTVDAAGEIALDTTDNQLLIGDSGNTARVIPTEIPLFSVTLASTSPEFNASGQLPIAKWQKDGRELTEFRCWVEGGTSFVINVTDGTNDTETITCGTSVTSDTDVATNDTFTADEKWYLEMGTLTGSPDYLVFEAYGYITRE